MKNGRQHPFLRRVWQALFLLWLLAVNILFYLQFRNLAASRLPHWLMRWHL